MSDLLEPLKCPECGGHMTLSPDGKSATCPYCRMTCIVRQPEPAYRYDEETDEEDDEPTRIKVNIHFDDEEDDNFASGNQRKDIGMQLFYVIMGIILVILGILLCSLESQLKGNMVTPIAFVLFGIIWFINAFYVGDDRMFGMNKKLVNTLTVIILIICLFI